MVPATGRFAGPDLCAKSGNSECCPDRKQSEQASFGLDPVEAGWRGRLPVGQARGTMVARSNGNWGKFTTGASRSLLRSKSIRRSKWLDRRYG
jgi:hypothetical protein